VFGAQPAPGATPSVPNVALDLDVAAQRDVRIQSGQVDIGTQGRVHVGGTLRSPTLAGRFIATDGTLDFYRTFTIEPDSSVAFSRSLGVVPRVDAYATTSISDPPTQVRLHVTGLATHLDVALTSDPAYTREQIVGLLAGLQNFGAVQGVTTTNSGQVSGQTLATNIAGSELSGAFTRNVLEPASAKLGSAIGLSSLAFNYDFGSGFGLGARKALAKNVDVIYAESFYYPQRTTIGLRATPRPWTALQFAFFNQPGTGQFVNAPTNLLSSNSAAVAAEPLNGTSGFSVSLQRKFR
jgi:hypothetical protein